MLSYRNSGILCCEVMLEMYLCSSGLRTKEHVRIYYSRELNSTIIIFQKVVLYAESSSATRYLK